MDIRDHQGSSSLMIVIPLRRVATSLLERHAVGRIVESPQMARLPGFSFIAALWPGRRRFGPNFTCGVAHVVWP